MIVNIMWRKKVSRKAFRRSMVRFCKEQHVEEAGLSKTGDISIVNSSLWTEGQGPVREWLDSYDRTVGW